jgi:hypothetical protein
MAHNLVRPVLLVVITLSLAFPTSCSGEREQANAAVAEANEGISEHNQLFEEARGTYEEVKDAVEAGEDPSGEAERISQARETMQEARGRLEEAREPLLGIRDLNVEPEIKEYAGLLSDALDAQLSAEAREIDFYDTLQEDPILADNRREALRILSEVGAGYEEAENAYRRAQELADSNPDLLRKG